MEFVLLFETQEKTEHHSLLIRTFSALFSHLYIYLFKVLSFILHAIISDYLLHFLLLLSAGIFNTNIMVQSFLMHLYSGRSCSSFERLSN